MNREKKKQILFGNFPFEYEHKSSAAFFHASAKIVFRFPTNEHTQHVDMVFNLDYNKSHQLFISVGCALQQ